MNGISPRPILTTQHQIKTSSTISEVVPELPLVVTDLITQYACEDYSRAAQPLRFDKTGKLVECDENKETMATIKTALQSSECDPGVKRSIFLNLGRLDPTDLNFKNYNEIINSIFFDIRKVGAQLNLDYVDFSKVNMRDMDLSDASMMAAKFADSNLVHIRMANTDLTGATFKNMQFLRVNLSCAVMAKAVLNRTNFKEVNMEGVNLTNAVYYQAHFKFVTASGMSSDDIRLQQAIKESVYDPQIQMTDSNLNEFLLKRVKLDEPKFVVILNGAYSSTGANGLNKLK